MKFCPNCGKEINEGADICLGCGRFLTKAPSQVMIPEKSKTPGKGKGIASLVLGIVAVVWSLSMLAGIEEGTETLIVEYYYNPSVIYLFSFYIGYTIFALTPSIIGLIMGLSSRKQYNNKMAIAGIILSCIALVSCLFVFIKFVINI